MPAPSETSQPGGYLRHPAIRGDVISFVTEDDLWSVPAAGGVGRRPTAHPSAGRPPAPSPDWSLVALTPRARRPGKRRRQGAAPAGGEPGVAEVAAGGGRRPTGGPGVVPLRPRGDRQPLLRPSRRLRPAPPHRPRGVLRPVRQDGRPADRLP